MKILLNEFQLPMPVLPYQIWNNELLCLVLWQNDVCMTSLYDQYDLSVATVTNYVTVTDHATVLGAWHKNSDKGQL